MQFDEPKPARRSLGSSAQSAEDRELQGHTMEAIVKQFKETDADEIDCCLAGWRNTDANGEPYLTFEPSPKYVTSRQEPVKSIFADFI